VTQLVQQAVVVNGGTRRTGELTQQLSLFKADGTAFYVPERAAAQTDSPAMTQAAITGGESPTEAEFNALRTDVVNLRTTLNALLAKMRTAGQLAP
jgi:hypothetical protein